MASGTTPSPQQIADLRGALQSGGLPDDPAKLIALIGELETLKSAASAACAAQAQATVAYDAARRSAEAAQGVPARRRGRGVAAEIALARRESPHRGQMLLGFAKLAHSEMPHTMARLMDGTLNEWRAMLLLRETSCLSAEQRAFADEELCADPQALAGLGTRRLLAKAKKLTYELDPQGVVDRARHAAKDRHVTLRPAPDTMTYVTALLPVAQGVALHAALKRDAASLVAAGDQRTRGQLMADLLVTRVTGVPMPTGTSTGTQPPAVPVAINLTMSATTLIGGHAAGLVEDEVVPAEIARLLAAHALTEDLGAWIRQLYTDQRGRLVAMTSRQRIFPQGLADFLAIRDQGICRTPYCGAPIRHTDHVAPADEGGQTSAENGQGLCEACNHTKQAPGWRQHPTAEGIETITPTGHRYLSHTPSPPGWREPRYVQVAPGRYQLVA